jgi:DNA-binding NarL/FixJ family response regulator
MTALRLLIADDHPLFRDGVARTLREAGIEVVAECGTAEEAAQAADRLSPDIALLDLSMPGGGLSALARITALVPAPKVAMLTVSEEDDDVLQALKGGALAYILKGVGARDLIGIVQDLAAGRSYVAPSLAMKVLAAMTAPPVAAPVSEIDQLTRREEDILRRVAQGLSNKEVGRALNLQEKTVKHYMTAILGKLQVRNRTEAALMAREHWKDG